MKKILILAAAAAVLCSCANKNKYAVDGKVEGANSMVYLFDEKDNILDSAAVANGVFRFEGVAEKPQAAILRDARDDGATFGAMLILEPGTINVTDDAQNPYRKKVTGTPANDATESKALANLMGADAAAELPVTSIKGTTGHMLGAAGAVEAIVCALSVARDAVPPTAGFAEAAEDCPVAVVTEAVTDYPQKVALSTSLGFGGHNAALAFSPYKG